MSLVPLLKGAPYLWVKCVKVRRGRLEGHPILALEAALGEDAFDIAAAQRIALMPADGPHEERSLEILTLEVVFRRARELFGKDVQDHRGLRSENRHAHVSANAPLSPKKFTTIPLHSIPPFSSLRLRPSAAEWKSVAPARIVETGINTDAAR